MYSLKIEYLKKGQTLSFSKKYMNFYDCEIIKNDIALLLKTLPPERLDFLIVDIDIISQFINNIDNPTKDFLKDLIEIEPDYLIDDSVEIIKEGGMELYNYNKAIIKDDSSNNSYRIIKSHEEELFATGDKTGKLYKVAFFDVKREAYIRHRNFVNSPIMNDIRSLIGKIYKSKREYDEYAYHRGWTNRNIYKIYFNIKNQQCTPFIIANYPLKFVIIDFLRSILEPVFELMTVVEYFEIESIKIERYIINKDKKNNFNRLLPIEINWNNKKYILAEEKIIDNIEIKFILEDFANKNNYDY